MDKNTQFGRIYSEIVRGYSKDFLNKQEIYFKHPTMAEHFLIYSNYDLIIESVSLKGVKTEDEKLKEAIKNDWWSVEKEERFLFFRKNIQNLNKTKNKLLLQSQKEEVDKQIKKSESIFYTYAKERKDIIGYTAEEYAQEKFFDDLILYLSYRDENLSIKYFNNEEEFYDLSEEDNSALRSLYTKYSTCFSLETIKLIAASGFFQNLIYLDTVPNTFWGNPTVKCSKHQIDLLVYGKMFKSTIESYLKNDKPISEEIMSDPDKFIQWFDSLNANNSTVKVKQKKSNSSNVVSSYVGATKEDLNKLGVKVEKLQGKSLLELAESKGGVLEKSDYFKARENN